jgi:hypothetical protein
MSSPGGSRQAPTEAPMLSSLTPRELAAAVTPLFIIDSRHQQAALNELVIRCEVAEHLFAESRVAAVVSGTPE